MTTLNTGIVNNWPNFLYAKVVDKNGQFTNEWQSIMQQIISYAQTNLSNEGHVMPPQSTDNIGIIAASDKTFKGTIWYDSTTDQLKVKLGSGVKIIQTTS